MQNKFPGSKFKAILWLIIGVFIIWTVSNLLENNGYFGNPCDDGQGHSPGPGAELERCLERQRNKGIF